MSTAPSPPDVSAAGSERTAALPPTSSFRLSRKDSATFFFCLDRLNRLIFFYTIYFLCSRPEASDDASPFSSCLLLMFFKEKKYWYMLLMIVDCLLSGIHWTCCWTYITRIKTSTVCSDDAFCVEFGFGVSCIWPRAIRMGQGAALKMYSNPFDPR